LVSKKRGRDFKMKIYEVLNRPIAPSATSAYLQLQKQAIVQPKIEMPPRYLRHKLTFDQQRRIIQHRKMSALLRQQANLMLQNQAKVTPYDIAATLVKLADLERSCK